MKTHKVSPERKEGCVLLLYVKGSIEQTALTQLSLHSCHYTLDLRLRAQKPLVSRLVKKHPGFRLWAWPLSRRFTFTLSSIGHLHALFGASIRPCALVATVRMHEALLRTRNTSIIKSIYREGRESVELHIHPYKRVADN